MDPVLAFVHTTDTIGFGREQERFIVNIVVLILKEIPPLQTVLPVNFYMFFWNNNGQGGGFFSVA
jgi:hypothetical protein